eukprot:TRINITY_DN587_c0_g1_i1.p1 TRINITY_DN587_c0_g1~~TRINITY_DN587_c0_g1_i1.p1  ORF type:complete len:160 (-),score=26.21 TRINITY_DN587_c0_g1_i1:212-691(-)
MYRHRLIKELAEATKYRDKNMLIATKGESLTEWKLFLHGPDDSPFKDGIFEVRVIIDQNYPMSAPKIYFRTKIFHPNIHWDNGEVCLDILKDQWTPSWTIETLSRALLHLMCEPNPDSPLNCDCGNILRSGDKLAYTQMARMYTLEYAIKKSEFERLQQ